jgi:hypothetical protein
MGVGGQRHAPAALPPGKTLYPLYRRLGRAPGPVWTVAENLASNGIRSPDRPTRTESLYRLSYPSPPIPIEMEANVLLRLLRMAKWTNLRDEPGRPNEKPSTSHLCSSSLVPSLCLVIHVTGVIRPSIYPILTLAFHLLHHQTV